MELLKITKHLPPLTCTQRNFALLLSIAVVLAAQCFAALNRQLFLLLFLYDFACHLYCNTVAKVFLLVVAVASGNFCFANFNLIWLFAYLPLATRHNCPSFPPPNQKLLLESSLSFVITAAPPLTPLTLLARSLPLAESIAKCSLCQQAFLRVLSCNVVFFNCCCCCCLL